MEPPQLGTLSPSFLQQCAHEAPQLSGTLPSTTFPTKPQSSLLWATTATPPPHARTGSEGGETHHTSPFPRVMEAPGSAIKQDPHSHLCLQREATVRSLTQTPV